MRLTRLHDEQPTKQERQCRELGADLYVDEDSNEEPSCFADPFDILAHREEQQGELQ